MLRYQYTDDDDHEPLQEVLSAFLVSESFAVDVISCLSVSTCFSDMKMMMMMMMVDDDDDVDEDEDEDDDDD